MYKGNSVLCCIPARGGSKGLPGKNIRKLLGKPLIAYSIEDAKESRYIDRTIVSTDDARIARISRRYNAEVPFIRPSALARDNSSTIDVLLHAMDWMEKREKFSFDILVLLHTTAPLRYGGDIDKCIELLVDKKRDSVFSVAESQKNPYFNMVELDGRIPRLVKKGRFTNRQSCPLVYDINCSIYVWQKEVLRKKKSLFSQKSDIYVMPKERSFDIDDKIDSRIVEMLLRDRINRNNR